MEYAPIKRVEIRAHESSDTAFENMAVDTKTMYDNYKTYSLKDFRFAYNPQDLKDRMKELDDRGLHFSFALVQSNQETQYTQNLEEARKFLE